MKHQLDLHRTRGTWNGRRAPLRRRRAVAHFSAGEWTAMFLTGVVGALGWTLLPAPVNQSSPVAVAIDALRPASWPELRRFGASPKGRAAEPSRDAAPATSAQFSLCHRGGGTNCVVDGDTFWMDGIKIRIADIDTPETHPARCPQEADLGQAATNRLQALLNAGPVSLHSIGRDTDRYGRQLRTVSVDGHGVGDTLVAEGLARPYEGGHRASWCD